MNLTTDFEAIREYLPLLLPLVAAQLALFVWALVHILTHKTYKHGNRAIWLVVVIVMMNFVGPILYFLFGKEEQ